MEKRESNDSELICKFPECGRKILAKGWCSSHYKQVIVAGKEPSKITVILPLMERIMARVTKTETCWLWNGALNNKGYGVIGYNYDGSKHRKYVHRVIFELENNIKLSSDQEVCHSCDVPKCVRPDHLFLGNHKINMVDMATKERSGRKKLTILQVREIRILKYNMSYKQLSEMFCVSKSSIKDIIAGRNYAWLK